MRAGNTRGENWRGRERKRLAENEFKMAECVEQPLPSLIETPLDDISSFEIRFLKAFGNLFHLSNTCMANTRDWKTKFSIKYYLITFSWNHTLFSAFSARPDRAFPTVFSTQYPRNGNGWAWGRGWALKH